MDGKGREDYYTLIDASDNTLESLDKEKSSEDHFHPNPDKEDKSKLQNNDRLVSSLTSQVEISSELISSSIDKIVLEVSKMVDGSESSCKVSSLQQSLHKVRKKNTDIGGILFIL